MIAYYAKRSPGEEFTAITRPVDKGTWVDGQALSSEEIDELISRYQLNANIVYDVRDDHELPRVEYSGHSSYVFLRKAHQAKSGQVRTLPLLCVLKDDTFLTLSTGSGINPTNVALSTIPKTTEQTSTLLLGVLATCVSTFEAMVQHASRSIDDTASRLRTHEITSRDFVHFVSVEASLRTCRMNIEGMLAVASRLRENNHIDMHDETLEALDDIMLHMQQLLVAISSHCHSVESIRNAYSTVANNSLNQRMKTLTVFTVLITLPNVFYGMYGMNVALPYADTSWAYPAIVGFTIVLIAIVYLVAKRLRIF